MPNTSPTETRDRFIEEIVDGGGRRVDQFEKLVWYNQHNGLRETRVTEALTELELAGMPAQNRARFMRALAESPRFAAGRQKGTVRLTSAASAKIDETLGAGKWGFEDPALAHQGNHLFHSAEIDLAQFRQDPTIGFKVKREGKLGIRLGKSGRIDDGPDQLVALGGVANEFEGGR